MSKISLPISIREVDALTVGFSLAFGVGTAFASYKIYSTFINNKKPIEWRKVGHLSQMFCFPLKSCGPIELEEAYCGQIGPEFGHIRDRVFMVTRESYEYVTARTYPKMVRIFPNIVGDHLTLNAPGMESIVIDIGKLFNSKKIKIQNWFKDEIDVVDTGDELAKWISTYILEEPKGLRVVFYPSKEPKPKTEPRKRPFKPAGRIDQGALQDETSFMLLNQGSIDEINRKLETKVNALRFRPNFVVKESAAWEEDDWEWIKIGDHTVFRKVQPCTRCIFTCIDPSTGERSKDNQPLKTLQSLRTFKKTGPTPVFGIQLGVRTKGVVRLNDEVYVGK